MEFTKIDILKANPVQNLIFYKNMQIIYIRIQKKIRLLLINSLFSNKPYAYCKFILDIQGDKTKGQL